MVNIYRGHPWDKDPDILDVTVKNGESPFAPTWDLVMGIKSKKYTEEEYTEKYYQLMRERYRTNRSAFDDVLKKDRVVFACMCPYGSFCHTVLLADIFVKLGATYSGELSV